MSRSTHPSRPRPGSARRAALLLLGAAPSWLMLLAPAASAQDAQVTTFQPSGMGVDWCASTNQVAYDLLNPATGFWQVNLCQPNGSGSQPLSPGVPGLPTRTCGSPAWYPTGAFVVAVVEKQNHPGTAFDATPGLGGYSDLWAISSDGSWCTQLTDVPDDANHGTIGGHFSKDGTHLVWTERTAAVNLLDPQLTFGAWVVKVADVTIGSNGQPTIGTATVINPGGGNVFNEGYGFSPDSSSITFASSYNQPSVWTSQIFTCALDGTALTQITSNSNYNEHAVWRPDGSAIVWMSNAQSTLGGTDWWMMAPNGTNPQRLTFFNEPSSPESTGSAQWAGLVTFSPDGTSMLGGVINNLLTMHAWIAQVSNLPASPTPTTPPPTASCGSGSGAGLVTGMLLLAARSWRRRRSLN